MKDLEVQIVKLEPMLVASTYAFSISPEVEAWGKLVAWAQPKGLLDDIDAHPIFGFNNPNPSTGNSKYGYEFWIKVGTNIEPEGDVRINEFYGGLYAVIRCKTHGELYKTIPASWRQLIEWCKTSKYKFGYHRWLEKQIAGANNPDELTLDLYCPIVE